MNTNNTDLTVHWPHYRVVSYIQHHGSQPDRGHYTVIQVGSEGAGASWLIDDEKDPQSLDDSMRTHAAQNMYVAVLINASTALFSSVETQLASVCHTDTDLRAGKRPAAAGDGLACGTALPLGVCGHVQPQPDIPRFEPPRPYAGDKDRQIFASAGGTTS